MRALRNRISVRSGLTLAILLSISLALAFSISGCAPKEEAASSAGVTSNIIGGFAVKGTVVNGEVTAYELLPSGARGKCVSEVGSMTDANGAFNVKMNDYKGPVWLEVTSGMYEDEMTGESRAITIEEPMVAFIPNYANSSIEGISITPLTSIASGLARSKVREGHKPGRASTLANGHIAEFFGLEDILNTLPADLTKKLVEGVSEAAKKAAAVIAGLSAMAAKYGADPMSLIGALTDDVTDGIFDGKGVSGAISLNGVQLSIDNFLEYLSSCVKDFLSSARNLSNFSWADMEGMLDKLDEWLKSKWGER